jgi:hydroxyethylthiazole kinase-like uncharacterized protein yjeF
MIPIDGAPILTAAAMRAAEEAAVAAGTSLEALMARAGAGVAQAARRLACAQEVLVLCGPGNNGGDGYVAASELLRFGHRVRVAAVGEPRSDLAARAAQRWGDPVEAIEQARPAPVIVDAVFGTGLTRELDARLDADLERLVGAAGLSIAVDLPSGVETDSGELRTMRRSATSLTLALGALKPAHVLQPAATLCGTTRLLDIGLPPLTNASTRVIARPALPIPGPADHKYSRGMVAVVAGSMEGAARLAGAAALRAGAGYAALFGGCGHGGPDALVHRGWSPEALRDSRVGAIVIGPGLGRDEAAQERLATVLQGDSAPLVIDGDALHLIDLEEVRARRHPCVLTPHEGEFRAAFGEVDGSAIDRARWAAERCGAVMVLKGSTTVISDGERTVVSPGGSPWLSTAGTGDVLAGAIGAMLARSGPSAFEAACAGVWLHAEAARIAGASFIADDLVVALSQARAER